MSQFIQSKGSRKKRLMLILSVFLCCYMSSTVFAINNEVKAERRLKILTSIKPIQLLVNDIQQGINSADILLKDNQNHHLVSLKPSQRLQLADADVVFYINTDFEVFLKKIMLTDQARSNKYVALGRSEGLRLLSVRPSGAMPHTYVAGATDHNHGYDPSIGHLGHGGASVDWHIWLSPDNAIVMLAAIRDTLSSLDPQNAKKYGINFNKASQDLIDYSMQTAQQMKSVMRTPFFTLHDGYQYFEEQFGLQSKATILRHGESSPSLKHMNQIKNIQKKKNVQVILKEHQFSDKPIQVIRGKRNVKVVDLDSLGQNLPKETTSYLEFIKSFTATFYTGLSHTN